MSIHEALLSNIHLYPNPSMFNLLIDEYSLGSLRILILVNKVFNIVQYSKLAE